MKQLTDEELEAVLTWLDQFGVLKTRGNKVLGRDFADCVLLAQLLKRLYPKIVELHNYPPRNSYTLKMDNWNTLNRKVLRKLGLQQTPDTLAQLCAGVNGAVERLCHAIRAKYASDERNQLANNYDDDTSSDNTDIMCVNVEKKTIGGGVQQVQQKMVAYALYERSQTTVYEQQQAITVLAQKIEHLDNLLKLKCQRIDDLLGQLARKSCRLKVESELLLSEPQKCALLEGMERSDGSVAMPETTRSLIY